MEKYIINQIKNLLESDNIMENDVVSLSTIASVVEKKSREYQKINNKAIRLVERIADIRYEEAMEIYAKYNFICKSSWFSKLDLIIGGDNHRELISFVKDNNDLISYDNNQNGYLFCIKNYGQEIYDLYNKLLEYRDYLCLDSKNIRPINIDFNYNVSINKDKVNIDFKLFCISKLNSWNIYEYNFISKKNIKKIMGLEHKIFDKVFVNISDCPQWMQEELQELRNKELKRFDLLKLTRKKY